MKKVKASNIYCVVRNFASHAEELNNPIPEKPTFFQKSSACLSDDPIINIPANKEIHHELEIVIAINEPGFMIRSEDAWKHVGGLCLGLDLTDRPLQNQLKKKQLPWFLAKSFPGSAVITLFESPDLKKWSQDFWLRINDQIVQKGQMSDMIFDIPTLIEFLSFRLPILKGDLIYTGTPNGVGPLNSGDELVLGLGNEMKGQFSVKTR